MRTRSGNTMTIGRKISLACGALVALTVILSAVAIFNVSRVNSAVNLIRVDALPGLESSARFSGLLQKQQALVLRHILEETPEKKSRVDAELLEVEAKFRADMKAYTGTITTAHDRELFEKIVGSYEHVGRAWAKVLPLSRDSRTREATALWTEEGVPSVEETGKNLDSLVEMGRSDGDGFVGAAVEAGASARFWALSFLVFSVISGLALSYFIIRGINQALNEAVGELREGAEQVSSASGQVSGSSQSLAQGASQQAASLEETAASSEEMASMTRKNAENSQQAAEFMHDVSQSVTAANTTLGDMMTSMEEIGASSGKISKIIRVIDEIAFQTNILALNAAVEAARAGEAGMGFAVVADEVRNLAQRSAQAAKDTAALIEDSILKSGEGSRKLGEVAASIRAITGSSDKVKTLVDEVDASSKEQAQGIEQISRAVSQMDEVTQRTAANAEESAAASQQLSAQSQALLKVIGHLEALIGTKQSEHLPRGRRVERAGVSPRQSRQPVHQRMPAARQPSQAAVGARTPGAFPLDDSEFTEF